jgi:hypothetical protein
MSKYITIQPLHNVPQEQCLQLPDLERPRWFRIEACGSTSLGIWLVLLVWRVTSGTDRTIYSAPLSNNRESPLTVK